MNTDVCAIIVSYNPTTALLDNIAAIASQVAEIIVIDNGSRAPSTEVLRQIGLRSGCRLIYNNDNLGIAAALNIGIEQAVASGYSWVATFDQDSLVCDGFIAELLRAWEECPYRDRVALISPRYQDPGTGNVSSYSHGSGESLFSEVTHTMTSGDLVRSKVFDHVGLFDAPFFMDCVDHEFCLRLRRHGYRLIEAHNALLQHALGSMTLRSLFGRNCKIYNHPPLRRYYNARNRVVVYKRYAQDFPGWVVSDLGNFCREIAGIILFEQDVLAKLAAIGKGVVHGLSGKMGKTD